MWRPDGWVKGNNYQKPRLADAYESGASTMLEARDNYIRRQIQLYIDSKITLTQLCVSLGWKFEEVFPSWSKYRERIERQVYQGMDVEIIEEMMEERT